jgi:hypothetical protein
MAVEILCLSDIEYGDAVLACQQRRAIARQRQLSQPAKQQEVAVSLFSHVTRLNKSGTYLFLFINTSIVLQPCVA